jgi:hypothetical protein
MTLYVYRQDKKILITHDGYVQLGIYFMSLKKFYSLAKKEYIKTYWLPDTFKNRYKRLNYQKHLNFSKNNEYLCS